MQQQVLPMPCPRCDTPMTSNECSCGFRYEVPGQRELYLQTNQKCRELGMKPCYPTGDS